MAGHRPVQEVHPPGDICGPALPGTPRVGTRTTRRRPVQHQLAHRAQDEEDEDAAEPVNQEQARTGVGQPAARAEEQPCSDSAADRDHLDLAGFETLW